MIEGFSSDCK